MTEIDLTLPPELDFAINEYYSTIEPSSAFVSRLEKELRQHHDEVMQNKTSSRFHFSWKEIMRTIRTQPILALLVVTIALLFLTGVAYAVGRLTGFIPGFGFTSDAQTVYLLEAPVETTSGDMTLRVDQAVSDESKFWVRLTVVGLPEGQESTQAFLLLPDGEKIPFQMGSGVTADLGRTGLTYIFPPLPTSTSDLILFVENLGGQSFRLPLQFRPAKTGEILPAEPEQPVQLKSETQAGITLVLDHIAPASDKTVFQVSMHFDQSGMILNSDWNVILMDKNGAIYPAIDITPDTMDENAKIFQTSPFTGKELLTLSLNVFPDANNLPVSIDFSMDARGFVFDPGPNPVVGQSWSLDEVIQIGGFTLRAVRASLASPTELLFEFEPAENLTGVMLYTSDPLLRGAAGGVPQISGNISAGMTFGKIPSQPFEVRVTRVYYKAHGSWEIQWQPPAAPLGAVGQSTSTPTSTNTPLATPTLAVSNPILLEIQTLARRFDAPFQVGPGWIHLVTETTTNPQAGQTYPPPYLTSEQWYEIDPGGYVVRSVWIDKDANGNTIQLAAAVGNYSVNFTFGDAGFNNSQPYQFSADMLTRDLAQAEQYGATVTREEITCDDGQSCILITTFETFSQPVQNPGETQVLAGAGRKVWISLTTGQQIQFQAFGRLEDGTERVDYTQRYLLAEKVPLPPQNILDILSKVLVP